MRGVAASMVVLVSVSYLATRAHAQAAREYAGQHGPHFFFVDARPGAKRVPVDASRVATLRRRIAVDVEGLPLEAALQQIAERAGLRLTYPNGVLPDGAPVHLKADDITVAGAFTEVLMDAGVDVVLSAYNQAVLVKRPQPPPAGTIAGRVTDAKTGEGIAGASVTVEGTGLGAVSDDSGQYRITGVAVGRYTVTAKRLGYERASQEVAVIEDRSVVANFALTVATSMLEQVVVTGTVVPTEVRAVPSPVTVITAEQIARQHLFTLAAIIRHAVPTAVAPSDPSAPEVSAVSVRGASSLNGTGNMKIFVDGIEASSVGVSPVDVTSIDRIEVIRGPEAATIYGADAASGVIQIFTKRGKLESGRAQIDAQVALGMVQTPYASYQHVLRQHYSASVRGGGQDVSYNVGGSYRHLADYAPDNGDTRQSTPSVYGGIGVVRGIFTADISGRYEHHTIPVVENPLARATGYIYESQPLYLLGDFVNETYGARLTVTPVRWWRNQVTLGADRLTQQNVQTQPRRITPDDTLFSLYDVGSHKLSVGYNSTVSVTPRSGIGGSLTVGVDHYAQDASTFSTGQALETTGAIHTAPPGKLNYNTNTITNTGLFAQAQISVRDALHVTGGIRAENNSTFGVRYGTTVLPRVGISLVHALGSTTVKLRSSYGESFRAPRAGQANGQVNAASIQRANPQLAPEQQHGWDAGVDMVFGVRASLSVSTFHQTAEDLIAFLQVASTPLPTYQYQNIGRVSNRGVEVEGKLDLVPWLDLQAQYGYVRSRIEAVGAAGGQVEAGDEPLGVPTHTAALSLTATPHDGTMLSIGVTYVGSWRQIDGLAFYGCLASFTADVCPASFLSTGSIRDFNVTYPAFAKVNATIAHRFTQQVEAFLSVNNLTNNESYEASNAAPVLGRTTMAGIHFTY